MGYYIVDESADHPESELYQYIKQHYPTMNDQSIEQSINKLSSMFDLDTACLIDMLFEERDQLKPDQSTDTPDAQNPPAA